MIEAMINEIKLTSLLSYQDNLSSVVSIPENVETIYFGGGTPSLLSADDIDALLGALKQNFVLEPAAEITLEANPDDIDAMKLKDWKSAGINRLSLGIQSFYDSDLLWMNRAHNAKQAMDSIGLIKKAGFTNFSVDFIYGTPTLNDDDWEKNIQSVIDLDVPHLSCYALTVEPNTALHKMIGLKKLAPVDPEKQASQFLMLIHMLEKNGYEHYEISNFAKPGFRSRHNSSYWQGKYYAGIGPSAHSFFGNKRKWNISNNALYIQSLQKNIIPFEEEVLTETMQLNEYIMTSLRTIEGLDLDYVTIKFGEDKSRQIKEEAFKFIQNKQLLDPEDFPNIPNRLNLTTEGKLFADGIAAALFFV